MRGCDEVKKNDVIGRTGRGYTAGIAFDLERPMGSSTCVSCGECMVSCPTGALTNKRVDRDRAGRRGSARSEWILQLPVFKGVSGTFLELNKNAVVKRRVQPGEVICREGRVRLDRVLHPRGHRGRVHRDADRARQAGRTRRASWFSKIRSRWPTAQEHTRSEETRHAMDPHRRPGGPAVRQPDRAARRRGAVRRDDLHEFSPALGDGAGEDDGRRAGDAAQRARHPAEEQDVPRRARSQVPPARPGDAPQERADLRVDAERLHRLPARSRRAAALLAGRSDRPPGGRGRRVLPGAARVREGREHRIRAATWC